MARGRCRSDLFCGLRAQRHPATVLVCIHGKSATNAVIKANGVLCVNWLQAEQEKLSQAFAGIGRHSDAGALRAA